MNKFIPMLILLLALGCSYGKEATRGVGGEIGDSFKKANDKESLLESRQKVVKSRNSYNSCVNDSPGRCDAEKEEYDRNVAEYVELQKKLSDL